MALTSNTARELLNALAQKINDLEAEQKCCTVPTPLCSAFSNNAGQDEDFVNLDNDATSEIDSFIFTPPDTDISLIGYKETMGSPVASAHWESHFATVTSEDISLGEDKFDTEAADNASKQLQRSHDVFHPEPVAEGTEGPEHQEKHDERTSSSHYRSAGGLADNNCISQPPYDADGNQCDPSEVDHPDIDKMLGGFSDNFSSELLATGNARVDCEKGEEAPKVQECDRATEPTSSQKQDEAPGPISMQEGSSSEGQGISDKVEEICDASRTMSSLSLVEQNLVSKAKVEYALWLAGSPIAEKLRRKTIGAVAGTNLGFDALIHPFFGTSSGVRLSILLLVFGLVQLYHGCALRDSLKAKKESKKKQVASHVASNFISTAIITSIVAVIILVYCMGSGEVTALPTTPPNTEASSDGCCGSQRDLFKHPNFIVCERYGTKRTVPAGFNWTQAFRQL